MATKKKGKATKKAAPKKVAAKKTGKSKPKKDKVSYVPNAGRMEHFMCSLIQAGYIGKTISEDSKDRRKASMSLRQMAQQLDRQVHKSTT